ncbi:ferritin-like domain-containing protein, partial [Nonomuraea sp. NN258]|nr:ferritin-like domain-containing protein [Nonomuraea antri]
MDKLRKALAAEHAAVFAYGLLGARTSGSLRERVRAAYDAHRTRRDQLRTLILGRGGEPAEAAGSYALPFVPSTAAQAVKLAVQLETGVTAAYLELVSARDVKVRQYAAQAMQEAVARSYAFKPGLTGAFPGMPA